MRQSRGLARHPEILHRLRDRLGYDVGITALSGRLKIARRRIKIHRKTIGAAMFVERARANTRAP